MPRIRTIKPEFTTSASVGRLSRDARLCFILLWTQADDDGRMRGDPRMLAGVLFPYDDDARERIGGWLDELVGQQHIVRYVVGGDIYIAIPKWLEHQRINRPTESHIPPPDESSVNAHAVLSETSGSGHGTVTVGKDRKGMEGKGVEGIARARESAAVVAKPEPLIQNSVTFERRLKYCAFVGVKLEVPKGCHQQFLGKGAAADDLDAWYRHLDAGLEANPEVVPDWPKWLWPKFESWAKAKANRSVLDNWVKSRERKRQQTN